MFKSALTISASLLLFSSLDALADELWVSGKVTNGDVCGPSIDTACNSIQAALNQAKPGDSVLISAGTYREDSSASAYTSKCTWMDHIYASLCMNTSGVAGKQITIDAAPGSEGKVIIDSEGKRVGFHLKTADYITIKNIEFRNNHVIGIASWGQVHNEIPDTSTLSIGVHLENNRIIDTFGETGLNVSGIGMWGSKDWVVRRNYVEGVETGGGRAASCIQSYGLINALVEHNELTGCASGIFWKDHYIKNSDRELNVESTIRYNNISAHEHGIQIGPRGSGSVEAGHNYIHHNVITGFSKSGVFGNMTTTVATSGSLHVKNNIFDGSSGSNTRALSVDSFNDIQFTGNIVLGMNITFEMIRYSDTKYGTLVESDYNIYIDSFSAYVDRYSNTAKSYSDLSAWQKANKDDSYLLNASNPDQNSITTSRDKVFEPGTLTLTADSVALGFMANGTLAAGPHESDAQVGWPLARPATVTNFTIE